MSKLFNLVEWKSPITFISIIKIYIGIKIRNGYHIAYKYYVKLNSIKMLLKVNMNLVSSSCSFDQMQFMRRWTYKRNAKYKYRP